jgi:hypothetical protein
MLRTPPCPRGGTGLAESMVQVTHHFAASAAEQSKGEIA